MLEDWKNRNELSEHEVMMKNRKVAVYLSSAIAVCYNGLVMSYLVISVMSYNAESVSSRQFVMQATFPSNAKRSPIFEILCIFQLIVAFLCTNSHATIEGLLTISVRKIYCRTYLSKCNSLEVFF